MKGLRGGSASVTRRGTGLTLTLRGLRFVRDAALDGLVTHDTKTGSVYAAVTLRAADGVEPRVRRHLEHEPGEGLRGRARQRRRTVRSCSSCARRSRRLDQAELAHGVALLGQLGREASMRAREKSSISRPCTISHVPPEQRAGNEDIRPSGTP